MLVTAKEAAAIQKFTLNVTVPLFYELKGLGQLQATGTLFKIENRSFIITARHIFDDLPDLKNLVCPESPIQGGLYTLGSFEVYKPNELHVDVAVIELKSTETVERFDKNWQFLSLDNIGSASTSTADGTFFVSGYPSSLTKADITMTRSKLVAVYSKRILIFPEEADQPVIPGIDLFFNYEHNATSVSGESISTPELPGISGASIWEVSTTSGIWTPEKATRVVGVQSAYFHSKYIRAKSWWAVAKVLEQADEQLASIIRTKVPEI